MRMERSLFAAAIAVALTSTSVHAVEEDSVKEWGRWATLATAAGGNNPVANNTVQLNLSFANAQVRPIIIEDVTSPNDPPSTVTPPAVTPVPIDSGRFFGAISDTDTSLIENSSYFSLLLGANAYGNNDRTLTSLNTAFSSTDGSPLSGTFTSLDENGASLTSAQLTALSSSNRLYAYDDTEAASKDMLVILRNPQSDYSLEQFHIGYAKIDGSDGITSKASFISGISSSLDSLQALANITSATYTGSYLRSPGTSNIAISVNFSDSSWAGTFDNPATNFTVTGGTITGADLTAGAGNISSRGTLTSGNVSASFFGDSAETVAGIADITTEENGRFVDTFATTKALAD